jgi:hypothetical protein
VAGCPCRLTRTGDAARVPAARRSQPRTLPAARSGFERRRLSGERRGRSARRPAVNSGGSAEPPPDWGWRPLARGAAAVNLPRGGRRGSTCRAAAAAVRRPRVGRARRAPGSPPRPASRPWLGSNEWSSTAAAPVNGDALAIPGSGRLYPASPAPAAAVTAHGGSRKAGLAPASPAPHPTAPAISCPCNVTCSPTSGSGPRARTSHRPASPQVCGKQPTPRGNSAASDGKVGTGVEKWGKVGYGGAQQTTGVAGLLPLRHSGLEPSRGQ